MGSKKFLVWTVVAAILFFYGGFSYAGDDTSREDKKKQQIEEMQKRFEWWPSDAKPAPVKDQERAGYWWWPTEPGEKRPWGNRGYVYVYKIIFDYKEEELPPPQPQELRASLLIKKILKNVKVYFDYDKSQLRDDTVKILSAAVATLKRNPESSILITGNCDRRGSEAYNEKLGRKRADTVMEFMRENGIPEERIRIISRGKLDAVAPITDLVGMQKDRNAQFMIAEVEEIMIPYPGGAEISDATQIEEGKFLVEEEKKIEGEIQVETKQYAIQKGDTLWKIAQKELGSGHRWKYLYELNKDRIKDPNKLKAGVVITIPVE
ncbi:MAG: OmpA family protein [Candidatus Omnitrophica bacterium]|nr:OmpA family protein [Candidatus Omnitrophota bacterium]MBU4477791.1 OmpA family protein [Candidatus Omnitrophota bacterium]MCG2704098.1 OmpA family protein [Candidatus Omnitrophota bacterium]